MSTSIERPASAGGTTAASAKRRTDTPTVGVRLGNLVERRIAYLLVLPTVIGIILVDVYPLLYNLWISFQERKISTAVPIFVGLRNYQRIVADPDVPA